MSRVAVSRPARLCLVLFAAVARPPCPAAAEAQVLFGYSYGDGRERAETASLDFYPPADRGCAVCRNEEKCSLAVRNESTGVFCGDVPSTFQPCCCSFRNECMTTIFSNSCVCYDGAREKEIVTTRFYLFLGLSIVAWGLLIYDKMCKGPYKVTNSNRHQRLAHSPSAGPIARRVDSAAEGEDSEGEQDEAHAVTSATAVAVAGADAADVESGRDGDGETAGDEPQRPQ